MKSRITIVELLRIIFCFFVVLHHDSTFKLHMPLGCIGVDFFFMLMGYFAFKTIRTKDSVRTEPMKFSVQYTLSKLLRVAPFAITGTILSTLVTVKHIGNNWLNVISYDILEVLQLQLPLINTYNKDLMFIYGDAPLWFLSATLFALPIILYLAIRYRDAFSHYIMWVLPLLFLALFIQKCQSIFPWNTSIFHIPSGILRALSSLMIGCTLYYTTGHIRKIYQKSHHQKLIHVSLILLFVVSLSYITLTSYGEIDCYFVIFIGSLYLLLAISLSETGIFSHRSNGIIVKLAKLTMPIYCLHWPLIKAYSAIKASDNLINQILLVILFCIMISLAFYIHHRYTRYLAQKNRTTT